MTRFNERVEELLNEGKNITKLAKKMIQDQINAEEVNFPIKKIPEDELTVRNYWGEIADELKSKLKIKPSKKIRNSGTGSHDAKGSNMEEIVGMTIWERLFDYPVDTNQVTEDEVPELISTIQNELKGVAKVLKLKNPSAKNIQIRAY